MHGMSVVVQFIIGRIISSGIRYVITLHGIVEQFVDLGFEQDPFLLARKAKLRDG
jgi:hypothetical protein